jgi:hypothetical protein
MKGIVRGPKPYRSEAHFDIIHISGGSPGCEMRCVIPSFPTALPDLRGPPFPLSRDAVPPSFVPHPDAAADTANRRAALDIQLFAQSARRAGRAPKRRIRRTIPSSVNDTFPAIQTRRYTDKEMPWTYDG